MKTYFDCLSCFVRQGLDTCRLITDDENVHEQVLREVLAQTSRIDLRQSPPAMAKRVHGILRAMTGVCDPYADLKKHFNDFAIKCLPMLREHLEACSNRLESAILISIAGNIIDFGVVSDLSVSVVEQNIEESLKLELDKELVARFEDDLSKAKSILYLADNAGEIIFDRLLIEQLPIEKVTVAVRGMPIINDATIEDARAAGLEDIVKVIGNGSDAPGTIISDCSDEFRAVFDDADVIISKGQGNYETLSEIDKNIYFVLKVKCPVIAKHMNQDLGGFVFMNDKAKSMK